MKTYLIPNGNYYYNHTDHNGVYVYDIHTNEQVDYFTITNYDQELRYMSTGEPYDEDYVRECIGEYRHRTGR